MMTKEDFYKDIRYYLDTIYKFPTEAKVIKVYTAKKQYYVDVKELNLDGSESDVILTKVELPKLWGVALGGLFCIPSKDTIVRVNFKKGNKNFPYVESVLGSDFSQEHLENELTLINDKIKVYIKPGYILHQVDDNFMVELDKNSNKISVMFDANTKLTASSEGWKMTTAAGTFDLASLIELKNSAGSLKQCLDTLADLLNEIATVTSSLSTSGSSSSQTAVPGQFIATLINIASAKTTIGTIFK